MDRESGSARRYLIHILLLVAVFVMSLTAFPVHAVQAQSADTLYTTGSRYYSDGDYDKAEEYFRKALAINRQHTSSMFMLGETLSTDVRRLTEAEDWYIKAIASARGDKSITPRALFSLGKLCILLGKQEDALDNFKKLLADYPDFYDTASVYNHMGVAAYRLDRYDKALEYFKDALKKDPMLMEATFNMKNVQSKLSILNSARYHQRMGDDKTAIEMYKGAIDSYPNYVAAWYQLGMLYLSEGNYADAVKRLERAKVLNHGFTTDKEIPYMLAKAYAGRDQEGDRDTALGIYAVIGTYKDSGILAGELYMDKGELDRAEELIKPYTALENERPLRAEAYFQMGVLCNKKGDKSGAIGYFQKALAEDPKIEKYKHPPVDGFTPAPPPQPAKDDEDTGGYEDYGDYGG
jgi:tetratricopeptide (TPR) repeat protein